MSSSYLRFPSGATVEQAKKDAKRLKKSENISNTKALNAIARQHGIDLDWDKAIEKLKLESVKEPSFNLFWDEVGGMYFNDELTKLTKHTRVGPPAPTEPSLFIDLSTVPASIYDVLMEHPNFKKFIARFEQDNILDFSIKQPVDVHQVDEFWQVKITFDGYGHDKSETFDIWHEFKEWILTFSSTGRVSVSERLDDLHFGKYHSQRNTSWKEDDIIDSFESMHDQSMYFMMSRLLPTNPSIYWGPARTGMSIHRNLVDAYSWRNNLYELYALNGHEDAVHLLPSSIGKTRMLDIATELVIARKSSTKTIS